MRLVAVWVLLALCTTVAEARPRRGKHRKKPAPAATSKTPKDTGKDAGRDDRPAKAPPADADGSEAPAPVPAAASDGEGKGGKGKVFDFTGLDISGRLRAPQLLYFLERANEELERASLERRSFIPEMMRTLEEDEL